MEIKSNSAIEAWVTCIQSILSSPPCNNSDPQISNLMIKLNKSDNISAPIDTLRKNVKWLYPEKNELQEVIFSTHSNGTYHYTYGERIFNFEGKKNQIDSFIIPLLRENPVSRRAIVTAYNPAQDSDTENEETPGIVSIYFKIEAGKLNITANIRSNNMLTGWPANIYQISLIQEHVAEKLGIEKGEICTISHNAHILSEQIEEARKLLAMI